MRGAVKRSFAETAKKGDGILNVLELSDSIKGATTEQPYRHAHSFPNRLTLNKSPFHPVHAVVFFRSARTIIDRKSTRLNSSHSQISYAVFCLKKKKNKNMHIYH